VALGRHGGQGRNGPVRARFVHIWTVTNGLVSRYQQLADTHTFRTAVGKAWECIWTMTLADGQITVEGPYYDAGDSVAAVTGGTGKYNGITGRGPWKCKTVGGNGGIQCAQRLDYRLP
jgi:ketosteroid isomerase-like protein